MHMCIYIYIYIYSICIYACARLLMEIMERMLVHIKCGTCRQAYLVTDETPKSIPPLCSLLVRGDPPPMTDKMLVHDAQFERGAL